MTAPTISYQQAVDWIFGLINFERKPGRSRDFRLDRTRRLLQACGNPHATLPVVHIAGTKGKGSTARMIAGILSESGLKTGLFMSPHITRFEERLTVDSEEPTEVEMVALVQELQAAVAECDGLTPTYFEAAVLLAWCFYRLRKTDIAVLEVGLGGRLDATNVCCPEVCIITSISLDHTAVLGNTVARIAAEKAGILKPGVPVVSGVMAKPAREVIRSKAIESDSRLLEIEHGIAFNYRPPSSGAACGRVNVTTPNSDWADIRVPFPGRHQGFNCALALGAVDVLRENGWTIPQEAVQSGLDSASLPGRVEIMGREPLVIVDAAHNEASIDALLATLDEISTERPRVVVFATTKQKPVEAMLMKLLPAFDHVVITQYRQNPRAVPWSHLVQMAKSAAASLDADVEIHWAEAPASAWELALSVSDSSAAMICTTGSFFIAAEIREIIQRKRFS